MAIMTSSVRKGMCVYGPDGSEIGKVIEVFGSQYGADEPGLAAPTGAAPSGEPLPFLKLCHEGPILNLGAKEVLVPTEAVDRIEEDRIVLNRTLDDLLPPK